MPWTVLAVGVLVASASAILIRYADDAHPLAISFWRCALGSLALAPFARRGLAKAGRQDVKVSVVAGAFLALHFATWIWSVRLTSVAASVLLVSTTPVFVALTGRWLLDEKLPRAGWLGIGVAMAGVGGIAAGGGTEGTSIGGNLLALAGGAAAAGYALGGRAALKRLGILEYAVLAYGSAAVLLLVACLATGTELFDYAEDTWYAIAGIVVGPQLVGHTLINLSLKDIDTATVSVTLLAEPVIATVLAFLLFSEVPSGWIYPGGLAILAGIAVVTAVRREPVVISE